MSTATTRKPKAAPASRRTLMEWSASAAAGSPLKVDRDKGVIYGVKVIGRTSRNSHGLREAVNGTEYTRRCLEDALPMYEGADVLVNHDTARKGRGSDEVFGQLRDCRLTEDGVRADLHYFKAHDMADRVCEDVERGLGVFGLSHDASAAKERLDRKAGRLVIEKLATVRSVDLVRKPASNRNLWESQPVKTTLRELLEKLTLTPTRGAWRKRLLEDDGMAGPMDAPMEPEGNEGDGIAAGIKQAALAIFDDTSLDAAGKVAKLKTLLTAHEKITGEAEPAEPVKEEEEPPAKDKDKKDDADKDKTEAVKEVAALKHRLAVRDLCETAGVKADKALLETLEDLPLDKARRLVEREKARPSGSPRSSGYGGTGGNTKPAADAKSFVSNICD